MNSCIKISHVNISDSVLLKITQYALNWYEDSMQIIMKSVKNI